MRDWPIFGLLNREHVRLLGLRGALLLAVAAALVYGFANFGFPLILQYRNDMRQAEIRRIENERLAIEQAIEAERLRQETARHEDELRKQEENEAEKIRLLKALVKENERRADEEAMARIREMTSGGQAPPGNAAAEDAPQAEMQPAPEPDEAENDKSRTAGPLPDETGPSAKLETVAAAPAENPDGSDTAEPGVRSFSVIGDTTFDLCGYTGFSVSRSTGAALLKSEDRSIPERGFRGWEKSVAMDRETEILDGCSVMVRAKNAAGVGYFIISEIR